MRLCCDVSSLYGSGYKVRDDNTIDNIKHMAMEKTSCFYHLSIDELVNQVTTWRSLLPRVYPHYAVKCNNHDAVLKTFDLLGIGFDCASLGEIKQVLALGVDPSRIIYAHPIKLSNHLKYAKAKHVKRMTFDSIPELRKIAKIYEGADHRPELLVRIRCDAKDAMCQLGMKFGVLPEEAQPLLFLAAKLHLNVVGVAFHVGSGCREPEVFLRAIESAKEVFIAAETEGHHPTVLDIGGGFIAGKKSNFQHEDNFTLAAGFINAALDLHFPEGCGVEIIAEPGRFMVSTAFTLATPITGRRVEKGCPMLFVDDGLYGSFNCILYEQQPVEGVPLDCHKDEPTVESSVWGPTCDSMDKILSSVQLPKSLATGDWLVWHEMGAYTLSGACKFNGFDSPEVITHITQDTVNYLDDILSKKLDRDDCTGGFSSGFGSDEDEMQIFRKKIFPIYESGPYIRNISSCSPEIFNDI